MSIGAWQLVLVLLLFLIPVGIAFAAVRLNTRDNHKGRREFALRVLALIMAAMVVELALPEGLPAALIGLVIALASVTFIAYWAVDRLRDIGSVSKNKAVITAVPVVGLFYLIYLIVAKGAGAQAATKAPQSEASARSPARSRKVRIGIMGIGILVVGLPAAVTVPDLLRGDYLKLCMNFSPGAGVGGQRRQRDYEARCLKWAAGRGDVSAQAQLGDWYANGFIAYADREFHVSQDHSEAVRWWQRAAQAGNAHAQLELAHSYFEGRGVEQDHQGAAYWYRRAAEQGPIPPVACLNLAFMYEHGLGIEQDDFIALRWYRQAAEYGFLNAMLKLGNRYAEGRTVPQDYVQAHKWFNLAGSGAAASEEALRDRAIRARERVAAAMTPEQIAEAQRLAREWEITW